MSEENIEFTEEQLTTMAKKAHLKGWLSQHVVSGKSLEEAQKSFDDNNKRAAAYNEKLANIRNTILEQAKVLGATS